MNKFMLITWVIFLWNSHVHAEVGQSDVDAIKSGPIKLLYAYYTANENTEEGTLRWYLSDISGSLDGYIFSLGDIESVEGEEKVSWREVSRDGATVNLVDERVVISNITDNSSHTFKDWGLGATKTDASIQEDIELIRNASVDILWWFFKAPNNAWYIIDKLNNIYKFEIKNGEYDWQKLDSTSFDMEFYINGVNKMIRPLVSPLLVNSLLSINEDANTGDILIGKLTIDSDGGRLITSITLSGQGSSNFQVDTLGIISLKSGAVLDYESQTEYNLTAYATNSVGTSESVTVNIAVINVSDMVATLEDTGISVVDGTPANVIIGNIKINNTGDSIITAMALSGVNVSDFNISTNGVITTVVEMNVSNVKEYNLTAIATNTAGNSQSVDVNITIKESIIGDQDGDSIPDTIELLIGTNPTIADEDRDGIMDGLQVTGLKGDHFFDMQWHIKSRGSIVNDSGVTTIEGNDLGLLNIYHNYMGYNKGIPIIVQIVDDGVDADHEDLIANMDLSRSYHHSGGISIQGNPSGEEDDSTHGTQVAGIMAARAFNGIGVRGIAPFANIVGSNWIEDRSITGLEKVWLTGAGANEIAVSNNSWGSDINKGSDYSHYLKLGSEQLRNGKGRIYVFAAGNNRAEHGNSNLSYIANNRYAIAVSALKHDNTYATYSSPGANILISGYGGNFYTDSPTIGTTTIEGESFNDGDLNTKTTWSEDIAENYTFTMNGTSAAAPTVSGCIALVLEACPSLTYRDIKYLLAKHGKRVDNSNITWQKNGGGLWHSTDYGYGLVNPKSMIDDCNASYVSLSTEKIYEFSTDINHTLDNAVVFTTTINDADSMILEWVELTVDSNYTSVKDYVLDLTSPSGAKTRIVDWHSNNGTWYDGGFQFSAAGFIDENSSGEWKVNMLDAGAGQSGIIKSLKLKFYGH